MTDIPDIPGQMDPGDKAKIIEQITEGYLRQLRELGAHAAQVFVVYAHGPEQEEESHMYTTGTGCWYARNGAIDEWLRDNRTYNDQAKRDRMQGHD